MDKRQNMETVVRSLVFSFLISMVTCMQIKQTFRDYLTSSSLFHMVVDDKNGDIFVGAKNHLYRLSPNLELLQTHATGPRKDNPKCPPPPEHCNVTKNMANTFVKGLALDYNENSLILCTSLFQGSCEILSSKNITNIKRAVYKPLISNSPATPNLLLVAKGVNSKDVLYIGNMYSNHIGDAKYQGRVPHLSSRNMMTLDLSYEDQNGGTDVFVLKDFRMNTTVNFIYGFSYKGFVYFIAVNNEQQSRIIRICQGDKYFNSYIEIPLRCQVGQEKINTQAQAASFDPISGKLFVAFRKPHSSSSSLCGYKMTETEWLFNLTAEYCYNGTGFLGPEHIHPKVKCQKSNSAPDFCGKTPISRNYSSIEGQNPIYEQPFIQFPSDVVTSVTVMSKDNHTDIYLGNSVGVLKKVVVSGTKASIVNQVELNWDLSINKEMFFSPDKKYLYAMTERKVFKVDISQRHCAEMDTCEACMQARDPVCGWCVMENRCTEKSLCKKQAVIPNWLPAGQDVCSKMLQMSPSVVSFERIQKSNTDQQITFKMGEFVLSSDSSDLDLQCTFSAMETKTNTKATNQDTYVTCPLPDNKKFDMKPTGKDYRDVDVALHVSGRQIVKRSIKMYDCSVHTSCTTCTQSVWSCAWQYGTHSCVSLSIVPVSQQNVAINITDSCPRVESPSQKDADIVVHSGGTKQIAVKLVNMQPGQTDKMKCKFQYLSTTKIVDGSVSSSSLVCDPVKFAFNNTERPYVQASFEVMWGANQYSLDMPRPITVRIYKCELMVTNCGQCLSMDIEYDCGWCGDRCSLQKECTSNWLDRMETCPNPQILRFSPSTGPVNGRTNITVNGINLGKAYTDIRDGVTVAGVKCIVYPEHYEPSTRFKCITDIATEVKHGKISVQVDNMYNSTSDSMFVFVKPMVSMMVPKRGPRSGGTSITIYGQHMDAGTQTTVDIGGSPCEVKRLNHTEIICVTTQQVSSNSVVDVNVDFGGYKRLLTQKFTYMEDPVITSISPLKSLVSGGIIMRVYGERLNLIQVPILFVEDSVENTTCEVVHLDLQALVLQTFWLHCPTPAIRVAGENLTDGSPKEVHFGLKLDGVKTWYNVSKRDSFGPLLYFSDPDVEPLPHGEKIKKHGNGDRLVIKGSFRSVHPMIQNIKVLVGKEDCEDISVSDNAITCNPPEKPDGLDHLGHAPVTLKIGFFRRDVGFLNYGKKIPDEKPIAMGIILGVVLPIIAIIILLTICIIRRQRKTKPPESGIPDMLKDEETKEEEIGMNHVSVKADMNGQIPDDDSGPYISELLASIEDESVRQNVSDLLIPRSKLDIGELIGKGSYGNTYEAQYKTSRGADAEEQQQPVAVKSLQGCNTDNESIVTFLQHCATLKDLQHPNVLSLVGVSLSAAEEPLIIRPHLQRGDLKNYVKDPSKSLTVLELLEMSSQVSEALSYLEGLHIVHRNLAARNCLVTDDKVVKVSDFSITQLYSAEYYSLEENKNKLVIKWWAPESIDNQQFTHKTDVWAFGILLWELLTRGVTPYPDVEPKDLKDYLVGGHRLKKPRQCPESLYLLMLQCWTDVPVDRPTFQEIGTEITQFISTNEESPDDKQPLKAKIEPGGSQEYLEVVG